MSRWCEYGTRTVRVPRLVLLVRLARHRTVRMSGARLSAARHQFPLSDPLAARVVRLWDPSDRICFSTLKSLQLCRFSL